jgi:aminoglycoside phosphotransferase (APT) family kinase protein
LAGRGTLPEALGLAGCWLATAFVEGRPIVDARTGGSAASRRWLEPAAALLARIHASRRPRHTSPSISAYSRTISLAAGRLVRAGHVTPDLVARLRALPTPARAPAALTHGDFSPDNLIVTASGQLAVVDEERVRVRPLAYDLARVVCLWALDVRAERRFLTAYERAGGDAGSFVAHRDFWIAAALSTSALYRLRYRPAALPPIVTALCAL